jgi:hypothetical protein
VDSLQFYDNKYVMMQSDIIKLTYVMQDNLDMTKFLYSYTVNVET